MTAHSENKSISAGDLTLRNLSGINLILGKNGCGKSSILRQLDSNRDEWNLVKYLSPERGGRIAYNVSVEQSVEQHRSRPNCYDASNPTLYDAKRRSNWYWYDDARRSNRDDTFREKSFVQLKDLKSLVNSQRSRRLKEGKKHGEEGVFPDFSEILGQLNSLLDKIFWDEVDSDMPSIKGKEDKTIRDDFHLSSGEKELISLGIEILSFVYLVKSSDEQIKESLLLLDEPDVHLHPDLQYRLIDFLCSQIQHLPIVVIISTHSTAILGALNARKANVCFMREKTNDISFIPIDEQLKNIVPIFGAHPLSNAFNQVPIMLVEGEDDERIWQQAVRSSQGRIKLWPCAAGNIDTLNEYETKAAEIIDSIYDNAQAYSLRDRDNETYKINDISKVIRSRLNCYAAENLILSDDVLSLLGTNWDEMKESIAKWLREKPNHPKHAEMQAFAEKFDRQNHKVKDLEVIFIYLSRKSKPWEVVVGQAIANLNSGSNKAKGSLADFLGPKIVEALKLCY